MTRTKINIYKVFSQPPLCSLPPKNIYNSKFLHHHSLHTLLIHPLYSKATRLEVKSGTSRSSNSSLNVGRAKKSVLVRNSLQSTSVDGVCSGAEIDVVDGGETDGIGVGGFDGLGDAGEGGGLDEDFGAHAGVEAGGGGLGVLAVGVLALIRQRFEGGDWMAWGGKVLLEDVGSSETDGWATRVDVLEVVVGVCDDQVSGILISVGVRVADEGCLEMVVEVGVGDGDVVGGVGDVAESVVEVLVVVHVGREVQVVNPDVCCGLNANGITG